MTSIAFSTEIEYLLYEKYVIISSLTVVKS